MRVTLNWGAVRLAAKYVLAAGGSAVALPTAMWVWAAVQGRAPSDAFEVWLFLVARLAEVHVGLTLFVIMGIAIFSLALLLLQVGFSPKWRGGLINVSNSVATTENNGDAALTKSDRNNQLASANMGSPVFVFLAATTPWRTVAVATLTELESHDCADCRHLGRARACGVAVTPPIASQLTASA